MKFSFFKKIIHPVNDRMLITVPNHYWCKKNYSQLVLLFQKVGGLAVEAVFLVFSCSSEIAVQWMWKFSKGQSKILV